MGTHTEAEIHTHEQGEIMYVNKSASEKRCLETGFKMHEIVK
jgi:hypothetical protein